MISPLPVVCCIGTTDPWNAAGLGLDALALRECGAAAVTVVAAISAQSRDGLLALDAVSPELIAAQLAGLARAEIAAYRIGALANAATIVEVARLLRDVRVPIVYDPVLAASGGGSFADAETTRAIVDHLLPRATIVTPNLREASVLTGLAVDDLDGMARAGARLIATGAGAALVKGGHLADASIDVLVERGSTMRFAGDRLDADLRGTGCLLAAGLAAELAKGASLHVAIDVARNFVREKIANGVERGEMRVAY